MTENEAIEALRLINTSRVHPFYSWEEMAEVRDMAIKALKEVQQYREIGTAEECREAVEKQKAKKIIIESYCPTECPTCGHELSISLGDGYYKYPTFLKRCPNCGQAITYTGVD